MLPMRCSLSLLKTKFIALRINHSKTIKIKASVFMPIQSITLSKFYVPIIDQIMSTIWRIFMYYATSKYVFITDHTQEQNVLRFEQKY